MFFFGLPFFVNDAATTEIYTLSLHDALPISPAPHTSRRAQHHPAPATRGGPGAPPRPSRPAPERTRGSPPNEPSHGAGTGGIRSAPPPSLFRRHRPLADRIDQRRRAAPPRIRRR